MLRRHLLALLVLTLVPLSGIGLVVGASPASAKIVRVKAPALLGQAPIGNEVVALGGNLGRSVVRPVNLQRHFSGRWRTVARGVAGPMGHYGFRIATPGAVVGWRVAAPPIRKNGKSYSQRISAVRTVYNAIQTAYANAPKSARVGTPVTVTLTFAPARAGRGAALQVNNGSGWQTLANLAQDGAGRAAFSYTPTTNGVVQFRAVAGAFHGAAEVTGPAASLSVLRTAPIDVVAHRGASLRNPENTIPAIKNAIKLGADAVELDVHRIHPDLDGKEHFVLLHDDGFQRTTNVEQVFPQRKDDLPGTFYWNEVQQLDAGSWKSPTTFHDLPVPDLAMALNAVDQAENEYGRKVRVILEFKGDFPDKMEALYEQVKELRPDWISATGNDDKVVFMSFDYQQVFQTVRDQHPDDGVEFAGVMDSLADQTPDWLSQMHVYSAIASPAVVGAVHAASVPVAVWTVDFADAILAAANAGADMVTTDDIETARSVLLR